MKEKPLYRAHIVAYPQFESYVAWDSRGGESQVEWERPVGWEASPEYVERYQTNKFFEPKTNRIYQSRSSAAERVQLLNSMGYTAIVQRSAPVEWPSDGEASVNVSETRRVVEAIRVLRDAGMTLSVDDLFAD